MKVLVIGGGQAGLGVAVALRKADALLELVLVDPKDYFEVRWASLRACFDEKIREDYAVLYESICVPWNITHVKDTVVALNKRSAKLSTDDTIEFDVCVVAVGAACPTLGVDPVATVLELRKRELIDAGKSMVASAGDVLVVGGGTLGCETAGEICKPVQAAGNKVIVAQSAAEVVPEFSARGRKLTAKVLDRMGVEVLTGNRAKSLPDKKWSVGDKVLEPGLVLKCTGYTAQNSFMTAGDLPPECVNEGGWINTDENFRVVLSAGEPQERIFAFGDCCITGVNKASIIMSNYESLVRNIVGTLSQLEGKEDGKKTNNKLKECNNTTANLTVLTLGPDNGVADLPFAAFESFLPAYKNKSLFIGTAMGHIQERRASVDTKLVVAGLGVVAVGAFIAMRAASM